MFNSFTVPVATPRKCVGRETPQRGLLTASYTRKVA